MSLYVIKIQLSNGEAVSGVRVAIEVENECKYRQYTNVEGRAEFEVSLGGEAIVYVDDQVRGFMTPGELTLTL